MTPLARRTPIDSTSTPSGSNPNSTFSSRHSSTLVFAPSWLTGVHSKSSPSAGLNPSLALSSTAFSAASAKRSERGKLNAAGTKANENTELGSKGGNDKINGINGGVQTLGLENKHEGLGGTRGKPVKTFETQFPTLSQLSTKPDPPVSKHAWANGSVKKKVLTVSPSAAPEVSLPPPENVSRYESQIERLKSLVPKVKAAGTKSMSAGSDAAKARLKNEPPGLRQGGGNGTRLTSLPNGFSSQRKPTLPSMQRRTTMPFVMENRSSLAADNSPSNGAEGNKPRLGLLRTLNKSKLAPTPAAPTERKPLANGVAWATIAKGASAAEEAHAPFDDDELFSGPDPLSEELSAGEEQVEPGVESEEEEEEDSSPVERVQTPPSNTRAEPVPIRNASLIQPSAEEVSSSASSAMKPPSISTQNSSKRHSIASSVVSLSDLPLSESLEREESFLRQLGWRRPTGEDEQKRKEWMITEEERRWFEEVMLPRRRPTSK
ncbi:uncharacterized protein VTP21DRAFT_9550 [Calcarisporiella thermophila]|uniref:uncharacterized protein n=1 Tax=Calcarisporiella thermophila TaxID=911321 RepID=UPI0037441D0E